MARRNRGDEDEGGYSWMDTYGDLVTLLLTFFVLLFAFSTVDNAKWSALVEAFTGAPPTKVITAIDMMGMPNMEENIPNVAFNVNKKDKEGESTAEGMVLVSEDVLKGLNIPLSEDMAEILQNAEYQEVEVEFSNLYEKIQEYIEINDLGDMLYAERDIESIYLRVTTGILFESGSAELKPEALPVLDELEGMFREALEALSLINVEGHTDNRPIHTAKYEDNWDLSTKRATNVIRYMLEKGNLPKNMVACAGYGEYQPIATNDTDEGRQQNRRVQFVLKKKIVALVSSDS